MHRAIIVTDLGFGDQGKGTTIDLLTRKYGAQAIIRTNGGAQALHHVVTEDGRLHGFSQFGSGTLVDNPPLTIHGPLMLCSPDHMIHEAKQLEQLGVSQPLSQVLFDERTIIITPWHRAGNWLREIARGDGHHGTCGFGIGETMQDLHCEDAQILRAGDLCDSMGAARLVFQIMKYKQQQYANLIHLAKNDTSIAAMRAIKVLTSSDTRGSFLRSCANLRRAVKICTIQQLANQLRALDGTVLFEGAQGVLLDELYGFHPHTTWSTTTSGNALAYIHELELDVEITRLGVLRAYASRHGAGPLMTYDPWLTSQLPEAYNREDGWPGAFRCGWFDAVTGRYAIRATGGVDGLVLTCLDRVANLGTIKYAVAYKYVGDAPRTELEKYFVFDEGNIVDIALPGAPSIAHQTRLTQLLQECSPIYSETTPSELIGVVEDELGVPVHITSQGQTASDKSFLK